jgi:hypothetical protein
VPTVKSITRAPILATVVRGQGVWLFRGLLLSINTFPERPPCGPGFEKYFFLVSKSKCYRLGFMVTCTKKQYLISRGNLRTASSGVLSAPPFNGSGKVHESRNKPLKSLVHRSIEGVDSDNDLISLTQGLLWDI